MPSLRKTMILPKLPVPDGTLYGPSKTFKGHAILTHRVRAYGEECARAAFELAACYAGAAGARDLAIVISTETLN